MGGRQSRRSVDITTTPKKEGLPADGSVGDAAAPGDGKLERIEETDTKPTTNGIAPHTDIAEDKEKDKDEATEKEKQEEVKAEETKQEPAGESPAESAEATTPTDATTPASPNAVTSPDSKETKKKEKMKKKWSFRSISFSKKDKNKPARDEAAKNGDVTKEETLAEGGEEAENGSATAGSPVEEKSAVSSPSAETEAAPASSAPSTETKDEASSPSAAATTATAASSPVDEKQEEPTPSAPTPVPVEEKKEEAVEKLEAEKKVVEVSPAGDQFVPDPVEVSVFRVQTVATTPSSIIERKTSEDIPSLPPSSPPPTPIDPSPLQQAQQAQQAAATVTMLAEALKLPAEAAAGANDFVAPPTTTTTSTTIPVLSSTCPPERDASPPPTTPSPSPSQSSPLAPLSPPTAESRDLTAAPQIPHVSPPDESRTEQTITPTPAKLEALPVVDTVVPVDDVPESCLDRDQNKLVEQSPAPPTEQEEQTSPKEEMAEAPPPLQENTPEQKTVSAEPKEEVVEQSIEYEVCELGSAVVKHAEQEHEEETPTRAVEEPIQQEIIATQEQQVSQEEPAIEPAVESSISICDSVIDSEEGPVPLSEEMLVVAKPAVVIPEDEEPLYRKSVEAIPEAEETPEVKKMDDEVVVPAEKEPLEEDVSEKMEAIPIVPEVPTIEDKVEKVQDEDPLPPPPPVPEKLDLEAVKSTETAVPCPEERSQDEPMSSLGEPKVDKAETECPIVEVPSSASPAKTSRSGTPLETDNNSLANEEYEDDLSRMMKCSTSRLEPAFLRPDYDKTVPIAIDPTFPHIPASYKPSPGSPKKKNQPLLTLPRIPSTYSTVVDETITLPYIDEEKRKEEELKLMLILHKFCNEGTTFPDYVAPEDIRVRPTVQSKLLFNITPTPPTVQETHQSTPESEAPVENNLVQDSTTEKSEEKIVVTLAAVPTPVPVPVETPAPPPAITEDVASVAKAVEEMEISAKAVAAATIECATTEIVADGPYENNVNE
ncbi:uncharacterized protein LOC143217358 [Lasioglossum baleicum]|uniref:uncharacterized protein LOC143217358 n=1 Tax=Lasioglossum baleicum TaxID=434251 RepID=UPI003FCDCCF8